MGDYPSTAQGLRALRYPPSDSPNANKWDGPYLDADVPLDPGTIRTNTCTRANAIQTALTYGRSAPMALTARRTTSAIGRRSYRSERSFWKDSRSYLGRGPAGAGGGGGDCRDWVAGGAKTAGPPQALCRSRQGADPVVPGPCRGNGSGRTYVFRYVVGGNHFRSGPEEESSAPWRPTATRPTEMAATQRRDVA